tara:strand:+ start:353 stop:1288 length:936 start_codon:yes stop_codon:yes gene_type:complete
MTPPLPAVPSQPSNAAATGGTWSTASGNGNEQVVSSTLGFAEYVNYYQWLHIEYSRNPYNTNRAMRNEHYDLIQCSAVDVVDVRNTELHMKVTAHTSCFITSGTYVNANYIQNQKFTMTPFLHDKIGKQYGNVDGSGVVFGPHGTIRTTQPLIIRRPTVGGETVWNETQTGTTHGLHDNFGLGCNGVSSIHWKYGGDTGQDYPYYLDDHEDLAADANHLPRFAPKVTWGLHTYMMNGPYNTSAEDGYLNEVAGNYRLIEIIEGIASNLTSTLWRYRLAVELPVFSNNEYVLHENDHITQMPHYDSGHHDYT